MEKFDIVVWTRHHVSDKARKLKEKVKSSQWNRPAKLRAEKSAAVSAASRIFEVLRMVEERSTVANMHALPTSPKARSNAP